MIALSTLIDSLLAANGPRPDVASIKPETRVGAPGAVPLAERVANEVRLPSRAALERMAPSAAADAPQQQPRAGAPAPQASATTDLSAAARIISAVLGQVRGDAGPVRGQAPVWASASGTPVPALAGALAATVDASGLFYESHLAQFAAGARSLAQMNAEPQAQWAPARGTDVAAPASGGLPNAPAGATPADSAAPALGHASSPAPGAAGTAVASTAQAPADGTTPAQPDAAPDSRSAADADSPGRTDATRVQAAYRLGEGMLPASSAADSAAAAPAPSAGAQAAGAAAQATAILPQSMQLVHQQLDLLATSVFRWSGQAWPGVPMEWSIQEDDARQDDGGAAQQPEPAAERRWTTHVSMTLPSLGTLDVRLGLDGGGVQASLIARDAQAAGRLASDGAALARRFEAAGLRLREFQVRAQERA